MTELFTVPLQPYAEDVPNHGEKLREFVPDNLRDLYVERQLVWERADFKKEVLSPEQKRERFMLEFGRLQQAGILVPHFYIVGGPEYGPEGTRIVAEKITSIPFKEVDTGFLANQARKTVNGMLQYVGSTEIGQDILNDAFVSRNYVFGSRRGEEVPDFYMVDLGGYMGAMGDRDKSLIVDEIAEFAGDMAQITADTTLFDMVVEQYPNCARRVYNYPN
jgi:hypothetical protein